MGNTTILVPSIVVAAAVFVLPLVIGIWLPDVFCGTPRTLASAKLADGSELRVVQYWNHVDFYTTELRHTALDGRQEKQVLDGDDSKSWHVPMSVDAQNGRVTVTLSGNRGRTVKW